jgi:hypothetical protein
MSFAGQQLPYDDAVAEQKLVGHPDCEFVGILTGSRHPAAGLVRSGQVIGQIVRKVGALRLQ